MNLYRVRKAHQSHIKIGLNGFEEIPAKVEDSGNKLVAVETPKNVGREVHDLFGVTEAEADPDGGVPS